MSPHRSQQVDLPPPIAAALPGPNSASQQVRAGAPDANGEEFDLDLSDQSHDNTPSLMPNNSVPQASSSSSSKTNDIAHFFRRGKRGDADSNSYCLKCE